MKKHLALLGVLLACASFGDIGFQHSRTRYLSGSDLFRVLKQKFSHHEWRLGQECANFIESTRSALGAPHPSNGELVYRGPSGAFVSWYVRCLKRIVPVDIAAVAKEGKWEDYLGATWKTIDASLDEEGRKKFSESLWTALPADARNAAIQHLISQLVGPGIIENEAQLQQTLFQMTDDGTITVAKALDKLTVQIALNEAFLTY